MKQFKKVIGWIGTIIGAPFYFLDKAANFYGKKKFIEISMILVMGVFVWAFIYNMKGEKITASYFFIGIPLYIIGWCIVGGAIVLAQGIIIAGIVFVCIPGSMLYEVCAPLRMEPLQYAEWLQKKEERESKSDYDEYVKKLKKSAENQQTIEQEAAQRQRDQKGSIVQNQKIQIPAHRILHIPLIKIYLNMSRHGQCLCWRMDLPVLT